MILHGDCRDVLRTMDAESVQTCVTSPPYWGLRDYGVAGQLGLEQTPESYVAGMVEVFREVRRVLRLDGTLWLNLGDSYTRDPGKGGSGPNGKHDFIPDYGNARKILSESRGSSDGKVGRGDRAPIRYGSDGLKPKDLVGIPWRVAFALQADGWYLRSDIIWHKPNPMPESVTDRPTKAHEYIFLLTKSERYFYDAAAIKEGNAVYVRKETKGGHKLTQQEGYKGIAGGTLKRDPDEAYGFARDITTVGRNARSVWSIATKPYSEAHFATFPEEIPRRCILAGSRPGDTVLDPFNGAGTTGLVAQEHGRAYVGIELNPEYIAISERRLSQQVLPL